MKLNQAIVNAVRVLLQDMNYARKQEAKKADAKTVEKCLKLSGAAKLVEKYRAIGEKIKPLQEEQSKVRKELEAIGFDSCGGVQSTSTVRELCAKHNLPLATAEEVNEDVVIAKLSIATDEEARKLLADLGMDFTKL